MTTTTDPAPPPVVTKDGNYTVQESAAWLRFEQQKVYAEIRNGRLAAKRATSRGKYIITGAALLDYRDNLPDA
ncbi:hypothetical protein IT072_02630 [Leifsonia sp. ZF2019]|uniref:helix-turn-helix domain-containing protein n=1 Tax=Leifsonia sp. ZF2019 TaxID=2781978 RepID=UPI001CBDD999|nr:helix-turn-helix domain-containing protein [Leifsonia sp. ZF2019]UAJ79993.1 hypothetical protein IT072_02630 [Leifsonia sp. ZF2019]